MLYGLHVIGQLVGFGSPLLYFPDLACLVRFQLRIELAQNALPPRVLEGHVQGSLEASFFLLSLSLGSIACTGALWIWTLRTISDAGPAEVSELVDHAAADVDVDDGIVCGLVGVVVLACEKDSC